MAIWLLFGASKAAVAVAVWASAGLSGERWSHSLLLPDGVMVVLATAFTATGAVLALANKADDRARWLGIVFVLFAGVFADRTLRNSLIVPHPWSPAIAALLAVQPAAFIPWFFWAFASAFPRTHAAAVTPRLRELVSRTLRIGCTVLATGILLRDVIGARHGSLTATVAEPSTKDLMWTSIAVLLLPSVLLLVTKLRTALPEERRRVALFVSALLLGIAPLLCDVLLSSFFTPFRTYFDQPRHARALAVVNAIAIGTVPLTTAYSVLVDRVLEMRFILRSALRYLFARYTVLTLVSAPWVLLGLYTYVERQRPLAEITSLAASPFWLLAVVGTISLAFIKRPVLSLVDRQFFRESHDPSKVWVALADSSRGSTTVAALAELVSIELQRTLHVDRVGMLVRSARGYADGIAGSPELPSTSVLATIVGGAATPFDVDLSAGSTATARLPADDLAWLQHSRARLLVPMLDSRGSLIGIIVLGDKRSELPYSSDDRQLLKAVAASAAISVERRLASPESERSQQAQPAALECARCGRVTGTADGPCDSCGVPFREAVVPFILAEKFQLEQRIGSGGMGTVYRAFDTTLDRPVALKALPKMSSIEAKRLRREARALAKVEHPHLELIHGVETWNGAPILILEYLSGGTLAARLRRGPLPATDVVAVGVAILDALHHLHKAGLIHRDVKPSNIGFTARGVPKLLDFGLAGSIAPPAGDRTIAVEGTTTRTAPRDGPSDASHWQVAGTLCYMSPEALTGAPPSVTMDLWALAVTLVECLTGEKPFAGEDILGIIGSIQKGIGRERFAPPDGFHRAVLDALADALIFSETIRPRTAEELKERLVAVSAAHAATGSAWEGRAPAP